MYGGKYWIQKVWISPYTLVERFNRKKHRGLLLKVLFSNFGIGYSQIHPLSQWGEGMLSDSLSLLKEYILQNKSFKEKNIKNSTLHKNFNLLSLSIQTAQEDAQARLQSKSLLYGYSSIRNHYLISDISSFDNVPDGFSVFKMKMGDYLEKETQSLRKWMKEWNTKIKFRLDFNGKIPKTIWHQWERENQSIASFIDFIEDPFSQFYFIPSVFSLAQDWSETHYCPIRVIKGSRYSLSDVCDLLARSQAQRFVFTHSLVHPLEARISYLKACQFYKIHPQKKEVCGLHYDSDFYEANDFSRYYSQDQFYSSLGKGLGFDDLWDKQKWIAI